MITGEPQSDNEDPGSSVEEQLLDEADRTGLQTLLQFFQPIVILMTEQGASTSRWLLASLLAVNAGAIVATLNSNVITGRVELVAAAAWLVGILLALGSGFYAMKNAQRGIKMMSAEMGTILTGLHSGRFPKKLGATLNLGQITRHGNIAIGIGLASALAFVVGAGIIGAELWCRAVTS